jgi:hypothetical protein
MPPQAEKGDSTWNLDRNWAKGCIVWAATILCIYICLGLCTIIMVENTAYDNYTMFMISFL